MSLINWFLIPDNRLSSLHLRIWVSWALLEFAKISLFHLVFLAQRVKNLPAVQETWVQSLGMGRPPGEGNSYLLQYSGLENPMDCIIHGVAKSRTWLRDFHFTLLHLYLKLTGIAHFPSLSFSFLHSLSPFFWKIKPKNTILHCCFEKIYLGNQSISYLTQIFTFHF